MGKETTLHVLVSRNLAREVCLRPSISFFMGGITELKEWLHIMWLIADKSRYGNIAAMR